MKFWEKLRHTSRGFQSEVILDSEAQEELARGTAIEGCINEQLIGTSIRGRFIAVQQLGGRSTFSRYLGFVQVRAGQPRVCKSQLFLCWQLTLNSIKKMSTL